MNAQRVRGWLLVEGLGPGGLRYLLALAVVLFHATRFVPIGHTAVYLFFVLSGYWMSRTYERTYLRTTRVLRTYAISRAWRILPLYVVILALTVTAYAGYQATTGRTASDALERIGLPDVLARNLAVVGLQDYDRKVIVPAWSLDIELRFYALLPLLVVLRSRWEGRALVVAGFAGVGALCSRVWTGLPTYGIEYLVAFVAGMALDRGERAPHFRESHALTANVLAGALLFLPHLWPTLGEAIFWHHERSWHAINTWEAYNVLLAVLLVPFVERNVRRPSSVTDRSLGHAAYSLYLVHWGVLCMYGDRFGSAAGPIKALGFAMYVSAACASAWLLERFVDRPSEAQRRLWLHGRALVAPAAVEVRDDRVLGSPSQRV